MPRGARGNESYIMKPQRLVERQIVVVPERIGGLDFLRPTGVTQIDTVGLRDVFTAQLLKMLEVAWISIGKRVECSCRTNPIVLTVYRNSARLNVVW